MPPATAASVAAAASVTPRLIAASVARAHLAVRLRRALAEKMKTMPEGQLKQTFQKMLSYDNVPIKPKTFKNFCKNSFNLQRNEALVDQMWVEFEPLVRKVPPAAKPAPAEPAPVAATTKQDDSATKKRSRSDSESDAKAGKKAKKAAKAQALAVLEGLSRVQLNALVAGIDAGVDLADELQKATQAHAGQDPKKQKKQKKQKKEKKKKKEKNKDK
eukprot:COSAG02_NODE_446_length_22141_cov_17.963842_10_plen_216_part_00